MTSFRPIMRMQWKHLLFVHWPIPVEIMRPLIPACFEVDTFDDQAWVGLVPFTMRDVSPVGLPRVPWRGVTDFHECNVRTYVRFGEEVGVYFFSLDAASRLGVWGAKTFFHLPYKNARISLHRHGESIDYRVDRLDPPRATMHCRWSVGEPLPRSQPGELPHFLTERYQLMTTDRAGQPRRCRIAHDLWPLRAAQLVELNDELVAAAGLQVPSSPPLVHHVDHIDVRAGRLETLRKPDGTSEGVG
ncbi:MAG: DUF2071 domain-containing protein [Phycisphaerales bacterium]|nr:MAG: DUF2071 domain-containing protein [Phycisphaerales bacterium]